MITLHQINPLSTELGTEIPVPCIPGAFSLPAVRVRGRLESTRSGKSHDWSATPGVVRSSAPCQPFVDMIFVQPVITTFQWKSPALIFVSCSDATNPAWDWTRCATYMHCRYSPDHSECQQSTWGLSVGGNHGHFDRVPTTWTVRSFFPPIDMSQRDKRETLIGDALKLVTEYPQIAAVTLTQGHLTARNFAASEEFESQFNSLTPRRYAPWQFYDHGLFADRVVRCDNYAVIKLDSQQTITSVNFPVEPLTLAQGWWLLNHPLD